MSNSTPRLELSSDSSMFLHLVRTFAAQAVVFGHALNLFRIYPPLSGSEHPKFIQNIGVLIFFILSGFLIVFTTISKKRRNPEYGFKNYFMDRFVRIFSGLIPAIILVIFLDLLLIHLFGYKVYIFHGFDAKTFIGNLFMLQDFPIFRLFHINRNVLTSFGSARPFWTVAVEWWLYMFFGFLLFWKEFKFPAFVKFTIFAFLCIVPVFNLLGGRGNGLTMVWYIGAALCGFLMYNIARPLNKALCFVSGFALLILAGMRYLGGKGEYDLLFASILASSLLFFIYGFQQTNIIRANWLKKTIVFFADYSFSIYLLHHTIIYYFFGLQGQFPVSWLIIGCVIGSNLVSIPFAMLTEMKHKKLRKWIAVKYNI